MDRGLPYGYGHGGEGKDGNKYEWQSWPPDSLEGMPPKRRRLAGSAVFWFILLGGLVGAAAEAAGIVQPWRSLLVAGVLAAIFVPLIYLSNRLGVPMNPGYSADRGWFGHVNR